jgi:hypothetical protein
MLGFGNKQTATEHLNVDCVVEVDTNGEEIKLESPSASESSIKSAADNVVDGRNSIHSIFFPALHLETFLYHTDGAGSLFCTK